MSESRPCAGALELSILILCRDEEKAIEHCVGEALGFLKRRDIVGVVVVVDNGSRDSSAALARAAGARVVHEARPGYGNAIIAGVEAAAGRDAILGDGDGEHDLDALDAFWDKLREGHDFVFGNRFAGGIDPEAMSFLRRRIGNPLLSGVGKLLTGAPLGDFHCGLRGFRVEAARALALRCPEMECASEMIVKAVSAGGRRKNCSRRPRRQGEAPHRAAGARAVALPAMEYEQRRAAGVALSPDALAGTFDVVVPT